MQGEGVEAALRWLLTPEGGLEDVSKAREAVEEVLAKKDANPRSLMYVDGPDVKFGPWGAGCSNPGCLKAALLVALQVRRCSEAVTRMMLTAETLRQWFGFAAYC
ncbi:hypothetical protein Vretifemale_8080 [Volvox reticuliferus]|uniref:Uncharacterized protein n=1 Tax=Volvox reticuliferus TaxID=1737510 RepID=A0A8J4CHB7_9CHLO|nr:hypothetical protein Vretifemale_8080 [Volvox reticuliferus]